MSFSVVNYCKRVLAFIALLIILGLPRWLQADGSIYNLKIKYYWIALPDISGHWDISQKFTLYWDCNAQTSAFRVIDPIGNTYSKGGGDPGTYSHVMDTISETFPMTDYSASDIPYLIEGQKRSFFRQIHGKREIGTWAIEVVCGSGRGEIEFWVPYPGTVEYPPQSQDGDSRKPHHRRWLNTVVDQRTLFSFPCRGMDVSFAIQYDSDRVHESRYLSYGWVHNYDMWIESMQTGAIPDLFIVSESGSF